MSQLPETIDGLPNICGSERELENAIRKGGKQPVYLGACPGSVDTAVTGLKDAVFVHILKPIAGEPDILHIGKSRRGT